MLITLLLFGCTNAVPEIRWLKIPEGPSLESMSFSDIENTDVIISGKSPYGSPTAEVFVKIDDKWNKAVDIVDTSYENDLDLSDKFFKFKINSSFLLIEGSKQKNIFIKIVFINGLETKETKVSLSTESLTMFAADANTPDSDSNLKILNLTITGNKIESFSYKFGDNLDCLDQSGYSVESQLSLNLDLSGLTDGPKKLCLLGKNNKGEIQSVPTEKTWNFDTIAPSISIYETVPPKTNLDNFLFTVRSLNPLDPVVNYKYVFSKIETDCSDISKYSTEKQISEKINVFVDGSKFNSKLFVCVIGSDQAGNWTDISSAQKIYWDHDSAGPTLPSATSTGSNTTETQSPVINLTFGSDTSTITSVLYKVVNNQNNQTVTDWSSMGVVSSLQISLPSPVMNTTYSVWMKLTDDLGNTSEGSIYSWSHDILPPAISVYQISPSKSHQKSPSFNVAVSDNSSIASIKASILDSANQVVSGPEDVVNNSVYVHSMTYSNNTTYTLRIESIDVSNNISQKDLEFVSANCILSDPNDFNFMGTICEEVSNSLAIGWKMQGGIIIAQENNQKLLVVESINTSTSSVGGSLNWGILDTGFYISSMNGEKDPLQKSYADSPVNTKCRTMTVNSLSDWFLPNLLQLTKIYCNTSQTPQSHYPTYDPSCSTFKMANIGGYGNISFWSNSEYSPNRAVSLNMQTGIENVDHKTVSNNYICVRSFIR